MKTITFRPLRLMEINLNGITRIVILTKRFAVKIPNLTYSWRNFLQGLLANMGERDTWRSHPRKDLLCPVVWCSWGGWILIMRRAYCFENQKQLIDYSKWIVEGLGGDDKPENYGMIDSRIVKIDYA